MQSDDEGSFSSEDQDDYTRSATAATSTAPWAPGLPRSVGARGTCVLPVVGISGLACRTAAGNAAMHLPGTDASRRIPFERWAVEAQEQVRW